MLFSTCLFFFILSFHVQSQALIPLRHDRLPFSAHANISVHFLRYPIDLLLLPVTGTFDAVSMLKTLQEEFCAEGKTLCICLVDVETVFHGVPRAFWNRL